MAFKYENPLDTFVDMQRSYFLSFDFVNLRFMCFNCVHFYCAQFMWLC